MTSDGGALGDDRSGMRWLRSVGDALGDTGVRWVSSGEDALAKVGQGCDRRHGVRWKGRVVWATCALL